MTIASRHVSWVSLLLATALVLHLFMMSGGHHAPFLSGGASGTHELAAVGGSGPSDGHAPAGGAHRAIDTVSLCFAVFAAVGAGVRLWRAFRLPPAVGGEELRAADTPPVVRRSASSGGLQACSRVAAGVLLRV